jgi:2,3-dihydroxybenzoate-AMP ligase
MIDGCVPWPDEFAARYREEGYWGGRPLGDLLLAGAARHADRTAVVCGERRLTYRELVDEVERLASGLRRLGIGTRDRVVVQLPNITEFVTLTFALFRIGAIPVLALPGHRSNEILHLCRHSEAVAYVVPDRFHGFDYLPLARTVADGVPGLKHILVVGTTTEFTPFASVPTVPRRLAPVDPTEVALFLLSGGTTGMPKLIPRTHNDYAYNALECARALGVDEHGVYLAANPVAHNAALGCPGVLGTLMVGGTAVLASSPSPDEVFPLIEREGVTLTTLVPPLVMLWMAAAPRAGVDLSGLLLQVGSSKFGPELARRARSVLGCRLTQWFGVGEGLLTYTRLDDPDDVVLATEGRPLCPADEIRVVDEQEADVPAGEVGELLTRGPYTIRGYYRAPEQNARSFTADGFFRTGDLVRLTPSGELVVSGRAKDIINRGGDKVSAEEVEDHLLSHPDIRDAAVVGLADPTLGERTCAFLIPRDGARPRLATVKLFLRDRGLATYKLPDQIEFVESFPHTAVGKVDKNALRTKHSDVRAGGTAR